ncbi:MAG TPA: diguanylate cyclase, partial [Thermosynechococcaceae cyanobacterium]
LDIQLPGLSGYEICTELKAEPQTRSIPIIFISARREVDDIVKGFAVGGTDYITKPFQIEEVLARVENQLIIQTLQTQLQEQNQTLKAQNEQLQAEISARSQAEQALHKVNQRLQTLACTDSLTEVANRRHLDQYLRRMWLQMARERKSLSLILCDLDHFKLYNDTYGHLAGDSCLRIIAQAIERTLRRPGDFVGRYGGEEFAVVLPNTELDGAIRVARNIHQEIESLKLSHSRSPVSPFVTCSLGISAQIPYHLIPPELLLGKADQALYQAKQRGRNNFCVYE